MKVVTVKTNCYQQYAVTLSLHSDKDSYVHWQMEWHQKSEMDQLILAISL